MKVNEKIIGDWYNKLVSVSITNTYLYNLIPALNKEYKSNIIYPDKKDVFKAFKLTQFKDVRVVILEQDPYFDGLATGLAFANDNESFKPISPSLDKILKCVEKTCYNNFKLDLDYSLESWAKQGILLLNTSLTVQKNKPNSHRKYWKYFTKKVIQAINENSTGVIFCLWGSHAKSFKPLINDKIHYILECTHPAYAARNNIEWECNHFVEINKIIEKNNGKEICIKW